MRIVQEPDGVLNISELLSAPPADSADAPNAPDTPEVMQPEEPSAIGRLPFLREGQLVMHQGENRAIGLKHGWCSNVQARECSNRHLDH
jgi:hypothetical protein